MPSAANGTAPTALISSDQFARAQQITRFCMPQLMTAEIPDAALNGGLARVSRKEG